MSKPKYLYHGSGRNIYGKLIPKKANDLDRKNVQNSLFGIYASSVKEEAISMALHSCRGAKQGSLQMHKLDGRLKIKYSIIYIGWPKQKYIFLYTLSSKNFMNIPKGSPQWVSKKSVKPIKKERLLVKNYIHLVRKPSKKEKLEWIKMYGGKKNINV